MWKTYKTHLIFFRTLGKELQQTSLIFKILKKQKELRKLWLSAFIGDAGIYFLSLKVAYEKLVLQWVTKGRKKSRRSEINISEPQVSSLTRVVSRLAFLCILKFKNSVSYKGNKATGTQRQFTL